MDEVEGRGMGAQVDSRRMVSSAAPVENCTELFRRPFRLGLEAWNDELFCLSASGRLWPAPVQTWPNASSACSSLVGECFVFSDGAAACGLASAVVAACTDMLVAKLVWGRWQGYSEVVGKIDDEMEVATAQA